MRRKVKIVKLDSRLAQERFRGLYNASKDAIGFASLDGILLDVNDSFSELTGYSKEELLAGKKYQDITPKEYDEYEAKIIEKIIRTGNPEEYEKDYTCLYKPINIVEMLILVEEILKKKQQVG